MKALLIIDMQKGSFTEETPRWETAGVVDRINAISKRFRDIGHPVIFIQHNSSKFNRFVPNTTEWELLDELVVAKDDLIIGKSANDPFYLTNLDKTLKKLKINEIVVTGCATDFCVEATVQSALTKDYKITVVKNGHTTADRPQLKAKQVIDHYNWTWSNMLPTKGSIEVVSYEQITNTN